MHASGLPESGFPGGVLIYVSSRTVFPIYYKRYNRGQLLPVLSRFGLKIDIGFDFNYI